MPPMRMKQDLPVWPRTLKADDLGAALNLGEAKRCGGCLLLPDFTVEVPDAPLHAVVMLVHIMGSFISERPQVRPAFPQDFATRRGHFQIAEFALTVPGPESHPSAGVPPLLVLKLHHSGAVKEAAELKAADFDAQLAPDTCRKADTRSVLRPANRWIGVLAVDICIRLCWAQDESVEIGVAGGPKDHANVVLRTGAAHFASQIVIGPVHVAEAETLVDPTPILH